MKIADLVTPERIVCGAKVASRKRVLELLSSLVVSNQPQLAEQDVVESLLARERLGGTGLGRGLALPHGRLKNLDRAVGAFVKLDNGIDFDAHDQQPVDLLFALLVPEQSTDEHLQILAALAQMFSDARLREQLREADSSQNLFDLLTQWQPAD